MAFLNKNFPRVNAVANMLYRSLRLYHSNRSLLAWRVLFSHLCRKMLNQPVPPFITIAPTYRCPCRCVHCGVRAPERDHRVELKTSNLAGDPSSGDVLDEMRGRLDAWMKSTEDPLLEGPVPAPSGAVITYPDEVNPRGRLMTIP